MLHGNLRLRNSHEKEHLHVVETDFLQYSGTLSVIHPFPGPKINKVIQTELVALLRNIDSCPYSCLRHLNLRFDASSQDRAAISRMSFPILSSYLDHFWILEGSLTNRHTTLNIDCPVVRMEGKTTLHHLLRNTVFRKFKDAGRLKVTGTMCECWI